MNLLLDLGNTRIKWTFSDGGAWRAAQASVYGDDALERIGSGARAPDRVVGVSVASAQRRDDVSVWTQRQWQRSPVWIQSQARLLGVTNRYRHPTQLGADRWAALIAARAQTSRAVCIVDCGSAVTVDALAADGEFRGGVILPGLQLARRSLASGTAAIREEEGEALSSLSRDTADAVAAGTLFGLVGGIERILSEQRAALGGEADVIVTGGDAGVIAPRLSIAARIDPDLVLKGVALIAEIST